MASEATQKRIQRRLKEERAALEDKVRWTVFPKTLCKSRNVLIVGLKDQGALLLNACTAQKSVVVCGMSVAQMPLPLRPNGSVILLCKSSAPSRQLGAASMSMHNCTIKECWICPHIFRAGHNILPIGCTVDCPPYFSVQMTKQLEDEKAKLIERKRQEQEERQRKQLELEKILEDNRRLVITLLLLLW